MNAKILPTSPDALRAALDEKGITGEVHVEWIKVVRLDEDGCGYGHVDVILHIGYQRPDGA